MGGEAAGTSSAAPAPHSSVCPAERPGGATGWHFQEGSVVGYWRGALVAGWISSTANERPRVPFCLPAPMPASFELKQACCALVGAQLCEL